MADMDSVFDKIVNAPVYGGGKFVVPGDYLFEIEEVKIIQSRNPDKNATMYLIVACEVVEHHNPEPGTEAYGEGTHVTWRCDLGQASGPSNAKQFFLALGRQMFGAEVFGEKDLEKGADRGRELYDLVCGERQGAKGIQIRCEAFSTSTRKGGTFTKTVWRPVDADGDGATA